MSVEPSSLERARRRAAERAIRERRKSIRACNGLVSWKTNRSFRPLQNLLHEPSTCSCQSPAWARITAELALTGGPRGLQLPSCRAGPVLLTAPEHDGLAARGAPSLFRARRGREHGPSALLPGL